MSEINVFEFIIELRELNPTKDWLVYVDEGKKKDCYHLTSEGLRGIYLFSKSKEEIVEFVRNYKG